MLHMNNSNEERLKIAVFIDVDNISIGVKQSMNRNFDVGTVLEALKEKGEIITKIAYGDWKRADDFSRSMTQHAIQMVQRNATPGGDKNGADIALALDALETAFTRPHINAFVIVGGDSDFIALVEKLKQYDKTVFVVGGRGFTSVILQKNCHEFIAYENLIGVHTSRKLTSRIQLSSHSTLENALPLIRRALKILSDREVSPQLGLLKSTLLQLDSTFTERDYGVGSFRDFIQKLADAGYIHLKQVDRSLLVELKNGFKSAPEPEEADEDAPVADAAPTASAETAAPAEDAPATAPAGDGDAPVADAAPPEASAQALDASSASKALEELFRASETKPHWPLYLRTFKQLLRSQPTPFDERKYGLSSTYDLARQAQRDGLLHIERNRQGILRIFPGDRFPKPEQEAADGALAEAPSEFSAAIDPVTGAAPAAAGETAPWDAASESQGGQASDVSAPAPELPFAAGEGSPEAADAPIDAAQATSASDEAQPADAAAEGGGAKPKAKPRTTRRKSTASATASKEGEDPAQRGDAAQAADAEGHEVARPGPKPPKRASGGAGASRGRASRSGELAVLQAQDARAARGEVSVVGDDDRGQAALGVQAAQQPRDGVAGLGV
jgi:uncharacterized LabA/DUF88 family protein